MGGVNKLRPTNRAEYLSGLPEEVYSKKRSSHMVRLLDALCGGAGVEAARNHLMLKRLQTSLDETHYNDLDEFYGRVLGFRRLESESYAFDPRTRLVAKEQEDEARFEQKMNQMGVTTYWEVFQSAFYPYLKSEIKKSWERIFDIDNTEQTNLGAAVWQLRQEDVVGINSHSASEERDGFSGK